MRPLAAPGAGATRAADQRHDNAFTVLRFVAASMVIVAHAYDLRHAKSAAGLKDPLARLLGGEHTMGWAGVGIFFVMSGYLIMNSLDRSPDLLRFARARALRILPGLAVCVLLSVLLLGLFVSTVAPSAFFSDPQTAKYVLGNISLLSIQFSLPGTFAANPMPDVVNGSLWTLPYEALCYVLVAAAAGIGLFHARRRALSFAMLAAASLALLPVLPLFEHVPGIIRLETFQRLANCFLIGMAYAAFGRRFRLRWWHAIGPAALAWLLAATPYYDLMLSLAIGLLVMWLAFVPSPLLRRLSRMPDYSYGIYVYAFPIQQVLILVAPGLAPPLHALIAFLLVLVPAGLSWHWIEKPALRLKDLRARRAARAAQAAE